MSLDMVRSAFRAMALWTALEFVLRDGGVLLLGWWLLPRSSSTLPWQDVVRFSALMQVVAMLVLGGLFVRKVLREGLSWRELGYERSRKTVAAGILGGAAVLALTNGAALIDYEVFRDPMLMRFAIAVRDAGYVAQCALVLGNGLLAPIVEDLAWRGYIQTRLSRAWSSDLALGTTAFGFALKHLIVDLSITRITTLVIAALALGFIRARCGTVASTASHLVMNLPSTLLLIVQEPTAP